MKQETVILKIPGLTRNYTFLHTSDCHIACAAPDATAEERAFAEKETAAWSHSVYVPFDALNHVIDMANQKKVDGLFLCGDMADYCSPAIADHLSQKLSQLSTRLYYVCGNHERSRAPKAGNDFYALYADMMHSSPGLWVEDLGELLIVGLDDGDKAIRQEQIDALKSLFLLGKPIILLIHIPILTDAIIDPVKQRWGENGPAYFLLGQPDDPELTRAFCRMLRNGDHPIAAIFAGHIHLSHTGEFASGRMQFTSAPSFDGVIRKVVLYGDGKEIQR